MIIFCAGRQIFLNYKNSSVGSKGTFFFCTVSHRRQNPPPWIRHLIQTGSIWGQLRPAICASCSRNYKHILFGMAQKATWDDSIYSGKCWTYQVVDTVLQAPEEKFLLCLPSQQTWFTRLLTDCAVHGQRLRTRPGVLCLPWAGWTLNSSVVAQLKPGTTEIQQEKSKETLPALPKSNQRMDESPWFFPNFSLVWFALSLPKFLQEAVKK